MACNAECSFTCVKVEEDGFVVGFTVGQGVPCEVVAGGEVVELHPAVGAGDAMGGGVACVGNHGEEGMVAACGGQGVEFHFIKARDGHGEGVVENVWSGGGIVVEPAGVGEVSAA